MQCELEFKKLDQQTDIVNKVEPLYYTGKLMLGILCLFISGNMLILIVISAVLYYLQLEVNEATSQVASAADYLNVIIKIMLDNNQLYMCNILFIS